MIQWRLEIKASGRPERMDNFKSAAEARAAFKQGWEEHAEDIQEAYLIHPNGERELIYNRKQT